MIDRLKKFFLHLFLFTVSIIFSLSFLFQETQKRTTNVKVVKEKFADEKDLNSDLSLVQDVKISKANESVPKLTSRIYRDSILGEFSNWIESYQRLSCLLDDNCTEHDPRQISHFLKMGEKLARKRMSVFKSLIQTNPQKALLVAIDANVIDTLPTPIRSYLENWEFGKGTLSSFYKCKGSDHAKCINEKKVSLEDGTEFRAHTYGLRDNIYNVKDFVFWGVSMGQDLAISEYPFSSTDLENGKSSYSFDGKPLHFSNDAEKSLFTEQSLTAERRAQVQSNYVSYPVIAGSNGVTVNLKKRYDLVLTPMTWEEAKEYSSAQNGRLVCINSAAENNYIQNLLFDALNGFDENNQSVSYGWIGATDDEDENGTIFNPETNSTAPFELNSTKGSWSWLSGDRVADGYSNWEDLGISNWGEPNSSNYSYGAIDFSDAAWIAVTKDFKLPFVIEYDDGAATENNFRTVNGFRKVLVVPARFRDEGYSASGDSAPLVDRDGNVLYPEFQQNSYEPVSQTELKETMDKVKEYFLRNSDNSFVLEAVITPTVTLDFDKYTPGRLISGETSGNLYDSSGEYFTIFGETVYQDELSILSENALAQAALQSKEWNYNGRAFVGVAQVLIPKGGVGQGFLVPPSIQFEGGNIDPDGSPDPDFLPAKAEAIVGPSGKIEAIKIIDSGAFYHGAPKILIDGVESTEMAPIVAKIAISWVVVTSYSAGGVQGLGYIGEAGAHAQAPPQNTMFAETIAHELGHNFNLHHANTYTSQSERPTSDEGVTNAYANPYSIMGNLASISAGELNIPSKVSMKQLRGFGLNLGQSNGNDVAGLIFSEADLIASELKEIDEALPANTFRIYRHDFGHGPYSLKLGDFDLKFPAGSSISDTLNNLYFEQNVSIKINGIGDGAKAVLDMSASPKLQIVSGGRGYAEEPQVEVLDENNQTILTLAPNWIQRPTGTGSYAQVGLRDLSPRSPRGLRGMELPASLNSPRGKLEPDLQEWNSALASYWISYRRKATEYGLTVINGHFIAQIGQDAPNYQVEQNLLDMTLNTPGDFSDCFLLPGHTFSDYDSGVHITPIGKGGTSPMEYLSVTVNIGEAEAAPTFSIATNTRTPDIGEMVEISVVLDLDDNKTVKDYGFGWFTNEKIESNSVFLNKPSITKVFENPGHHIVRAVVSNLQGGVSSKNIVFTVGDYQNTNKSSISGTVRSGKQFVQGARVLVSPAKIINHEVSITGNERDWFLPTGENNPLSYVIDGIKAPNLTVRKGEVHRFNFDNTAQKYAMAFYDHPQHEASLIKLDMLVTPNVDDRGTGYTENPDVHVSGGSAFANYLSYQVGTIEDYQNNLIGDPTQKLLVSRPGAKSLLQDTNVTSIKIHPTTLDDSGLYLQYGGRGHDRDNLPNLSIFRSSLWEDYVNEPNATAIPYVDGIGTISPCMSYAFLGNAWQTRSGSEPLPEVVVWGTSQDANVSVTPNAVGPNGKKVYKEITIHDQGTGYEPNATMAVLHYPLQPLARWTFDRHESLFDDKNYARYQASPAWNREILENLVHYWDLDEESGTILGDKPLTGEGEDVDVSPLLSDIENNSTWGVKGRALDLDLSGTILEFEGASLDSNFTISFWVKPNASDHTFTLGDASLTYNHTAQTFKFISSTLDRKADAQGWSHIAIVYDGLGAGEFYLDGDSTSYSETISVGSLSSTDFNGSLDEVRVYSEAMSEGKVKYLAGRSFLDISGNKYHASGVGPDFLFVTPGTGNINGGSSTEVPGDGPLSDYPGRLGDSFPGEGHGHSIFWDDNDSYLDLSTHAREFAGYTQGSISFWVRSAGRDESGEADLTVFSATNTDDNATYLKVMIRDNGYPQFEVFNNGQEVSKFYALEKVTHGLAAPTAEDWHHVVLVVGDATSAFWVDGELAETKTYDVTSSGDQRAFFADVENMNFMAIGRMETSEANATSSYRGCIDDFTMYDRPLNATEISYLYGLKLGREQIPRLEAVVDAVGSIKIDQGGHGYKETPDVVFSFGQEGNVTTELDLYDASDTPAHGKLAYNSDKAVIMSYYMVRPDSDTTWRDGFDSTGWRVYGQAFAVAELNASKLDHILWTKEMDTLTTFSLPDNREVSRRFIEYVTVDASGNYALPNGLFGYVKPPELSVDPPSSGETSTAFSLFFLDKNTSARIVNSGQGYGDGGFTEAAVRVSGKGFRPSQVVRTSIQDQMGNLDELDIKISEKEGSLTMQEEDGGKEHAFKVTTKLKIDGNFSYTSTYGDDFNDTIIGNLSTKFTNQIRVGDLFYLGDAYTISDQKYLVSQVFDDQKFTFNLYNELQERSEIVGLITKDTDDGDINFFDPDRDKVLGVNIYIISSTGPQGEHVFYDWESNRTKTGEPRTDDLHTEFNKTISHVILDNPGFGYSMPVKLSVVGGYPKRETLLKHMDENGSRWDFRPAVLELNASAVDSNGTLGENAIVVIDGGKGYELITNDAGDKAYFPAIQISGGGGNGAFAIATDLNVTEGNFSRVEVIIGGRGYFNTNSTNIPKAALSHTTSLTADEEDANFTVRLGGLWDEIPPCDKCTEGKHGVRGWFDKPSHSHPWVEIWDRARTEEEIDTNEDRAHAVAKIKDGKIEKIIVTESGRGYRDPVAYVRGVAPKHHAYDPYDDVSNREWRCTNIRETIEGQLLECGHIERSSYPPESCLGEVDENFLIDEENTDQKVIAWQKRHTGLARHLCKLEDKITIFNEGVESDYNTTAHMSVNFKSRKCGGTKVNFVLLNDYARFPYEDWEVFDASFTLLVRNGEIQEIVVDDGGDMYSANEIDLAGSGSGVDAIPIFDEDGKMIRVIFDDPKLRNLEYDQILRPQGAGQGFQERPWSWDQTYEPTFGVRETHSLVSISSEKVLLTKDVTGLEEDWIFGSPAHADFLGDRIVDVEVTSFGKFSQSRDIDSLAFDFNGSHRPDSNDGQVGFVQASATPFTTTRLTKIQLDQNGTYLDNSANDAEDHRWRSLFDEQPSLNLINTYHEEKIAGAINGDQDLINILDSNKSSLFRLNGANAFNTIGEVDYIDLRIDERFPSKFYYGFGAGMEHLPAMGAEIIVTDGLPGMNWAENEPAERNMTAYTDQAGYYMIPDLEPGIYNLAVFMEDPFFQETTFRPSSYPTNVSQVLYVPGMPDLILETDNRGIGRSTLVWSAQARSLAKPSRSMSASQEYQEELKMIQGIGAGFQNGERPQVIINPFPGNTSSAVPSLTVVGQSDGSLILTIVDDENTTNFNPNDRFTVTYSSSVSGKDFFEDFMHSSSETSSWQGSLDSVTSTSDGLFYIVPNDGNGTNFVEVPLNVQGVEEANFTFSAIGFDATGTPFETNNTNWSFSLDYSDVNQSNVAVLSNVTGISTDLNLFSTLKRGRVEEVQILGGGIDYTNESRVSLNGNGVDFNASVLVGSNGEILDVNIASSGSGYNQNAEFIIHDLSGKGSGAVLKPILGGGQLILEANITKDGVVYKASTVVRASPRNVLSPTEKWLDFYIGSFKDQNSSWWSTDEDSDGLNNMDEYHLGTHPFLSDTDMDGLNDGDETMVTFTNPLRWDTDGDGVDDRNETEDQNTNPLLADSDFDGLNDRYELEMGLDPMSSNPTASIGGIIFNPQHLDFPLFLKKEVDTQGTAKAIFTAQEEVIDYNHTKPYVFSFPHLELNKYHRLSAFLDTDGNASQTEGEPFAVWEGIITQNIFNANLYLKDSPPSIAFSNELSTEVSIPDGLGSYEFAHNVEALDVLDGAWDPVNPQKLLILVDGSLSGYLIDFNGTLSSNYLEVNQTIPLGTYNLSYQAFDSSGEKSSIISQAITVQDNHGPVISLISGQEMDWVVKEPWSDPLYKIFDNRDANESIVVTISGNPNINVIGTYAITYRAVDTSGNISETVRQVDVKDKEKPSIYVSQNPLILTIGQALELPSYSANDNYDGDITAKVTMSGQDLVDVNTDGDYSIVLEVVDSSGNRVTETLVVRVSPPAYTLAGNAIDGYLVGSSVIFDSDGDGISDLSVPAFTDQNGEYVLRITEAEFIKFDENNNSILDPNEGRIIVSGGVDGSTGFAFLGSFSADANASVVTPLTTLISGLLDLGLSKSKSLEKLNEILDLNVSDITDYDPLQKAVLQDESAAKILIESARVANLFKQTESLLEYKLGAGYKRGSSSLALSSKIASGLSQTSPKYILDEPELLEDMLKTFIDEEIDSGLLSAGELEAFVDIVEKTDALHESLKSQALTPRDLLSELSKQQLAVEQEVISVYQELATSVGSVISLAETLTTASLIQSSNGFTNLNLFAPQAEDFRFVFRKADGVNNVVVKDFPSVDYDGDTVEIEITSGNIDTDGDGIPFLVLSAGDLIVQDADELSNLMGQQFSLIFSMTDGRGKSSEVQGIILIDNGLTFESETNAENMWVTSSWFGSFYSTGSPWIYHYKLGWLYVYSDDAQGYWFWDAVYSNWWWSNPDVFPYFIEQVDSQKWKYFDLGQNTTRAYDFDSNVWLIRP
ncbi:MAG: DUF5011 domain-containing protein [Opitutales bacterium]|nr:DUF5011 domain-containing protein [Opitutales bacterium]